MEGDADAPANARIEVRFSAIGSGCLALAIAPLPGGVPMMVPGLPFGLLMGAACAMLAAYGLFLVGASMLFRAPLLIVDPAGVHLPVAGNVFLPHDRLESWAEPVYGIGTAYLKSANVQYWTFSLQARPRQHLDLSGWAWIRRVRANTLLGGDLLFGGRFIDIHPQALASAIARMAKRSA